MANITFGGLASGMDTGAIVSELMNLERQPLERLEREKSYLNNRLDAFKKFDTKLDELKSFFEDFDTSEDVRSFTATAASEEFFTISAGSTAVGGSFQVEVQNLAQVQKDVSAGYASKSSADFTAGTITINGTDITVEANDSLSDIADKINDANTGDSATGISASIINDGTAEGYRIVLTGKDAETTFTASVSGVSSGGTALTFANTQSAELASIVVDGITITSKNNTIADAIPGASISLLKENEAGISTTVAVETDNAGIKDKINEFVSKYNGILSYIDEQKDADWGRDNGFQGVRRKLQNLLVTNIGGSGNLNYLVDIGIETDQYTGKISVNDATLDDLIDNDLESLEGLFLGEDGVDGISTLFKSYLEGATDNSNGILAAKEKSTDMGVRNLDNNIQRMEMRLEKREELLNAQFAAMEQLVSGMNSTASYIAQQMTMLAGITPGASNG
jgi:flagellar hook-associated protein 2